LRLQPRACQCNDNGDFVITSALGATAQPGVDFVPGSDCDDCVSPIALPFPVLFYGSTFNSVNAAANGNLQFNSGNGDWVNTCLPAASFNNTIFAYWDDLDMRPGNCPGCGIFTSVIGSAPNRIFNIEYVACPRDDCGGYINFHIYLYEGTQEKFDVIYSAIDTTNGDSATVAVQRGTGSQFTQHECVTGGLSSGLKLSFRRTVCNLPTPTPTFTSSRTPTNIPTQTPTRTVTFTNSPTPTLTSTATPTARLVAHVTWQGRPAQPNALQQLPITLTLKLGTTEVNYPSQNTDASGFFTVSVGSMPNGTYNWRVKGPKYLANTGSINLTGGAQTNVEMGLMKVGDCNNDNVISVLDFNILKGTFGKASGDPGYDARGDLNGDNAVSVLDFNLQKGNFGQGGSPPLRPTLP
jgi:hypothetical protein